VRGTLATVAGWLDALPAEAVVRDPRLCVVQAWLAINLGELDAVEGWIQAAEQGTLPGPFLDGLSSVAAAAAMLRACLRQRVGDAGGAVAAARDAVAMERDSRTSWCTVAHAALGVALYWHGDVPEADAALVEALRLASPPDDNLSYLHALGCLACASRRSRRRDGARGPRCQPPGGRGVRARRGADGPRGGGPAAARDRALAAGDRRGAVRLAEHRQDPRARHLPKLDVTTRADAVARAREAGIR
jgi:LuxR family maltose regulon positive regulatory protein